MAIPKTSLSWYVGVQPLFAILNSVWWWRKCGVTSCWVVHLSWSLKEFLLEKTRSNRLQFPIKFKEWKNRVHHSRKHHFDYTGRFGCLKLWTPTINCHLFCRHISQTCFSPHPASFLVFQGSQLLNFNNGCYIFTLSTELFARKTYINWLNDKIFC
jgi:hypothetical protein